MEAIKFEEHNVVYAENQPEYKPLPALKDDNGTVVTVWQMSEDEIKQITETKQLYLAVMTFNKPLQPVFLTVFKQEVIEDDIQYV